MCFWRKGWPDLEGFEGERLTRVEDALVKFYLRYGKKWRRMETMPPDVMELMKGS